MTTDEALAVLRPLIDDCERKCWHPTPCDDCARPRSALDHLATMADPDALTAAYLAGVHHDGECRRHSCRRVRIEMQVEIERLREEVASLEADAARLDYIERTFSGMTNRERYLPVRMIWGNAANGRTLREACDKYMRRDAARGSDGRG